MLVVFLKQTMSLTKRAFKSSVKRAKGDDFRIHPILAILFFSGFMEGCGPSGESPSIPPRASSIENQDKPNPTSGSANFEGDSAQGPQSGLSDSSGLEEFTWFSLIKEEESQTGVAHFRLVTSQREIRLTVHPRTGLLISEVMLPEKVMARIQALFLIEEKYPAQMDLRQIMDKLGSRSEEIMDFVHQTCFTRQNLGCLKELAGFDEIGDPLRGEVLTSMAFLTEDYGQRRSLHEQSLLLAPQSRRGLQMAQIFSLQMAELILGFFEEEVKNRGLDVALGISEAEAGKLSYLGALVETTANTYNVMRIITSKYLGDAFMDELIERQSSVLSDIRQKRVFLRDLIGRMEKSDYLLGEIPNVPASIAQLPFTQLVIQHGLYLQANDGEVEFDFPAPEQFSISGLDEFTNPSWKQVLLEQVNILNIYLLVRGPALLRAFGKTKMGIELINRLRLTTLVERMGSLPSPWNAVLLWLAIETADGCIVRYAYATYMVGEKMSKEMEADISKFLKDRMSQSVVTAR